jgi:hypothetical protein
MNLDKLIEQLVAIDEQARRDTARAVNVGLTLRNWAVGFYINHFELLGKTGPNTVMSYSTGSRTASRGTASAVAVVGSSTGIVTSTTPTLK